MAFTAAGEVVFVRQFRPGAGLATLELPGGLVDMGDADALAAARRELREETGYDATDWRLLPPLWHDAAHARHRLHFAVGRGATRVVAPAPEATEEVAVEVVLPAAALADPTFAMAGQVAGLLLALRAAGQADGHADAS